MLARFKPFSSLAMVAILPVLMCACADEPQDTKVPTVEFVQESETEFNGSADLAFTLTDNIKIGRIQIFVDGNPVVDETLNSSNKTFEFQWDTKTVDDGEHEIKVIVTDTSGNETQQTFTVVVDNDLLTLFIPEHFIPGDALWVFLSDHAGNLLGAQQAQNNTELVFSVVEGFDDETLMIHLFNYFHSEGGQEQVGRSIYSYAHIAPGQLHLTSSPPVDTDHGVSIVTINDMPGGYRANSSGTEIFSGTGLYLDENTMEIATSLTKDQAEILITLYHDDGSSYYKLMDTGVGDDLTVSFNDFTEMTKTVLPTPGADNVFLLEVGFRPGAPVTEGFVYNTNTVFGQNEVLSYNPGNTIFSSFTTVISTWYGDDQFEYITHGPLPPATFKKSEAGLGSYDFTDQKVKMSINDPNGDMVLITAFGDQLSGTLYTSDYWQVFMPHQASIDFKMPSIPTEIISAYYPEGVTVYPFNQVTLDNNINGKTYEQVMQEIFNATGLEVVPDYETIRKIVHLSNPSGRTRPVDIERKKALLQKGSKFLPLPDRYLMNNGRN